MAFKRTKKKKTPYYRVAIDYETRSWVDLRKRALDVYANHHSTEITMAAWAVDRGEGLGEVQQWVPCEDGIEPPQELIDLMNDPYAIFFAWNAPFERIITKTKLGIDIPLKRWKDSMIVAMSCSFPGNLGAAGEALGLDADKAKMADGKKLIRKFSVRRAPTKTIPDIWNTPERFPEEWEQFKLYNRQDVVAETTIYDELKRYQMPGFEWGNWRLDRIINEKGIPIDLEMVTNACDLLEQLTDHYSKELKILTGLDNPNSGPQLLPWLRSRGYPYDDLKKGHVQRAKDMMEASCEEGGFFIDHPADEELGLEAYQELIPQNEVDLTIEALRLRLEMSQASPKKHFAIQRAVDNQEKVLRNTLQFCGAQRTWRWAGRIFQPQNLPGFTKEFTYKTDEGQPRLKHLEELRHMTLKELLELTDQPMALLKSATRPAFRPPPGKVIIDADLNAIENRALGWISGDKKILRVFEQGLCPYLSFATMMFKETYENLNAEYRGGDGTKRKTAKPAVLGAGYMLGKGYTYEDRASGELRATGLLGYAWAMGITDFTQEMSNLSVDTFRSEYKDVKNFWYGFERAVKKVIRDAVPMHYRMFHLEKKGPFLRVRLPSGRYLHYYKPQVIKEKKPWGEMGDTIIYEGLGDNKQWITVNTHPGKLTENLCQAVSRDLLVHGMRLAHMEGLDIRLHVHDQISALSDEDKAEEELEILIACMEQKPKWALDLPLRAEGEILPYFMKT